MDCDRLRMHRPMQPMTLDQLADLLLRCVAVLMRICLFSPSIFQRCYLTFSGNSRALSGETRRHSERRMNDWSRSRRFIQSAVSRSRESCLSSGEYSLQELARRAINAGLLVVREITSAEESLFFNLNTPADLAAIATR